MTEENKDGMTEVQRKLLASWQRAGYDGYGGWLGYKRNKTEAQSAAPRPSSSPRLRRSWSTRRRSRVPSARR